MATDTCPDCRPPLSNVIPILIGLVSIGIGLLMRPRAPGEPDGILLETARAPRLHELVRRVAGLLVGSAITGLNAAASGVRARRSAGGARWRRRSRSDPLGGARRARTEA